MMIRLKPITTMTSNQTCSAQATARGHVVCLDGSVSMDIEQTQECDYICTKCILKTNSAPNGLLYGMVSFVRLLDDGVEVVR